MVKRTKLGLYTDFNLKYTNKTLHLHLPDVGNDNFKVNTRSFTAKLNNNLCAGVTKSHTRC